MVKKCFLAIILSCSTAWAEPEPTVQSTAIGRQDSAYSYAVVVDTSTGQFLDAPDQYLRNHPTDPNTGQLIVGNYVGQNNTLTPLAEKSYEGGDDAASSRAWSNTNVTAGSMVQAGYQFTTSTSAKSADREARGKADQKSWAANTIRVTDGGNQFRIHFQIRIQVSDPPVLKKDELYIRNLKADCGTDNEVSFYYDAVDREWVAQGTLTNVIGHAQPLSETIPVAGTGQTLRIYDAYVSANKNEALQFRADSGSVNFPAASGQHNRSNNDEGTTGSSATTNGFIRIERLSVVAIN